MTQSKPLRFIATLEKSTNKLWGSHLCVPQSVAKKLVREGSRRVLRTLNGSESHQCALLPYGDGAFVLSVNNKWCKTLNLEIGSDVRVGLQRDESAYGLPVPAELKELFRQDAEGNRLFHALTPGRQRTLLYIVGSARHSEERARTASIIVRHLQDNNGKVNRKQLNQSLKRR
ncbi:MAG: YdeI/OmpD-associated family protein [Ignavibacteriales bacterium]|nr:YdeI/OmpD-associated family protein [Ignavibacteriales bacterium]